ncbi:MAG TPA: ABC transporter substrate-binding protein [Phycisphaerales bacterium]|nr:ABC transporter substrate-binding protein [Phycisphaerales bacterium]HCD32200.1 ABC transporter substrate-binding protein [Phycisphaerales bacterium]|tara:strand:+ start:8711 stop:9784 length:1074 start_codon:yes stop_codon:yes gene_type:complete
MNQHGLQTPSKSHSNIITFIIVIAGLLVLGGLLYVINNKPTVEQKQLIVYCAHDQVFSEPILKQFEKDTGIKVYPVYDTEATKSLGLTERLANEKDNPRCDVFWNNEILGTLDLQSKGILQPYIGKGYNRIPSIYKDPQGQWVGFAARMRVWIINTNLITPTPQAIDVMMEKPILDRVAFAKPLYGTTRTHYTVLWQTMGEDALKKWHKDIIDRQLIFAQSNGQTKNLVAQGNCTLGWTDTDDFFVAKDAGQPVEMLPYRLDDIDQTICIPNTVMMIRNCPNPDTAKQFIDYIVSEKIELQLSQSSARQIPLGPVDESKLSDNVKQLKTWAEDGFPLMELQEARQPALDWLKSEYLQ